MERNFQSQCWLSTTTNCVVGNQFTCLYSATKLTNEGLFYITHTEVIEMNENELIGKVCNGSDYHVLS